MNEGPEHLHKKDSPDISRRSFFGKVGEAAAYAAMGSIRVLPAGEVIARSSDIHNWFRERTHRMRFEKWKDLSAPEREGLIDAEINEARSFIRGPEGTRILREGTDDEIFGLLQSMPPLLREHIAGTKYDVPKENWPSVAVNGQAPMHAMEIQSVQQASNNFPSYGNGVFTDGTLLTNWHVTSASKIKTQLPPQWEECKRNYETGVDAVRVRMPASLRDARGVHTRQLTDMSDQDMNGSFVRIAGIDPDESAAPDGTKVYPSVAIRVTERLAAFLRSTHSFPMRDPAIENSFIFLAPPGESMQRRSAPETGSRVLDMVLNVPGYTNTRMHGMSGSPVLLGESLAGILNQVREIAFKGQCLEVGFFHGPDIIHQALIIDPQPGDGIQGDFYSDSAGEDISYPQDTGTDTEIDIAYGVDEQPDFK